MQQYELQYVQVALGRERPSFFFFFGGTKFTYVQYISDSTRQNFDVWTGVARRPVERAAEMRQPIKTSNFRQI